MTRAELVEFRESRQRIAEIRRRHEIEQLVSDDFRKLHELRVALTIEATVRAIAARRISGGEFHPSLADKNNLGKSAGWSMFPANHLLSKSP